MRLLAVVPVLFLAACSAPSQKSGEASKAAAKPEVKIAQFYATAERIGKGEKPQLCYSVTDAESLALSPPVEKVWPALSRCFEVSPASTTKYTLTATGANGRTASESLTIDVGPARAAPASAAASSGGAAKGRYIVEVTVNKLTVAAGEPVVVCYTARNASSVKITPGLAGKQSADKGCITDNPKSTTTYTVVATGEGGQTDTERVKVTVR